MEKIVFYGGTFDPIHNGHFQIAKTIHDLIKPDVFYFVPLFSPVHKADTLFNEVQRLKFLKATLAQDHRFQIYDDEIKRQGKSYTIETLQRFIAKHPIKETDLYYVIGSDQYYQFKNWKNPEQILQMAKLIVVSRPGHTLPENISPEINDKYIFVKNINYDISSSILREYFRQKNWQKLAEHLPFDINLLKE